MTTYRLVPAASRITRNEEGSVGHQKRWPPRIFAGISSMGRSKRSTINERQQMNNKYQEFAGKYIQYNIINLNEIE